MFTRCRNEIRGHVHMTSCRMYENIPYFSVCFQKEICFRRASYHLLNLELMGFCQYKSSKSLGPGNSKANLPKLLIQPFHIVLAVSWTTCPMTPDRWESLHLSNSRFHVLNLNLGVLGARECEQKSPVQQGSFTESTSLSCRAEQVSSPLLPALQP